MTADEYRQELADISARAGQHAEAMERKEYTDRAELQRDLSITIELWQRRADILAEVLEDADIMQNIDYISEFGVTQ